MNDVDLFATTLLHAWFGSVEPSSIALVGLLLAGRLIPLVVLTPWLRPLGTNLVATLSVSAMLWMSLLPHAVTHAATALPTGFVLGLTLLREVLLGMTFAVVARLPLSAIAWAGGLADQAGGVLPRAETGSAPLSRLYRWLGLALFVSLGGAELALQAVADGLLQVPLGGLIAWSNLRDVTFSFVSLCSSAVMLGLVLAMPVLLGTFLIDVTQALVSRWLAPWPSPQLWIPTKQIAAVALALLSLSFVASTLPDVYVTSITHARSLLGRLTP